MNQRIIEMSVESRPYERCLTFGAGALTDAELLAVILRTGTKGISVLKLSELLLQYRSREKGLSEIMTISLEELESIRGIGRIKAVQILCLAEIVRRIRKENGREGSVFSMPSEVADYYMEKLRHNDVEQVHAMFTDNRNKLIKSVLISQGTVNSASVSPREIFREALSCHAAGMILVHNHPSGAADPSEEDIRFSETMRALGKMMNVPLHDSIIIGDRVYCSFREKGIF